MFRPPGDRGCGVGIDAANLCDTMPRVLDRVAQSAYGAVGFRLMDEM